jgi:hypothetical protein
MEREISNTITFNLYERTILQVVYTKFTKAFFPFMMTPIVTAYVEM